MVRVMSAHAKLTLSPNMSTLTSDPAMPTISTRLRPTLSDHTPHQKLPDTHTTHTAHTHTHTARTRTRTHRTS
jgi:hypothetical protein